MRTAATEAPVAHMMTGPYERKTGVGVESHRGDLMSPKRGRVGYRGSWRQ